MLLTTSLIILLFTTTTTHLAEKQTQDIIDLPSILRSIALIYTDDELDPEVEQFISYQPEPIWEDNAYVYLWGMNRVTDEPYKVGTEILKLLEQENLNYNFEKRPYNYAFADSFEQYSKPESQLLCKKNNKSCILDIINNEAKTHDLLSEYGFYIQRYLIFLSYRNFKQIADMNMDTPITSYRTIVDAQKLYHISLLSKIDSAETDLLIEQLLFELHQLRNKLQQIDTLLGKMVMLSMLNENIEVLNYLIQKNIIEIDINESELRTLSADEMSIFNAIYQEQAKNLKQLYDYIDDPNRLVKKEYKPITRQLMKLISFLVAKPNLTANTIYNDYSKNLLNLTKGSSSSYYEALNKQPLYIHHDPIRNYMVWKTLKDVFPDYYPYQARAYDIDIKLQLMRQLIHFNTIDEMVDESPAYIEQDKVCYPSQSQLIPEHMFPEYLCLIIY